MNTRSLIIGSTIIAALLGGALLFASGGDDPGREGEALEVAQALEPAPDGGATDGTDGTPRDGAAPVTAAPAGGAVRDDDGAAEAPGTSGGAGSAADADVAGTGAAGAGGAEAVVETPLTSSGTPSTDASEGSQEPSKEAILRATSRAYEGLTALQAGFEQSLVNTLLGRTTRSRGTLYQRQPDRFLMDFSDPEGDLIVSDGEFFWMYFPSADAKQVLRTRRGGQGLDLKAQFIGDPVQRFESTYHGTEAVRGRPAHVLTLVPREPVGYSRLKVWIDRGDHLVRRFELTETSGNVRHFELHDLVANPSLPDSLFEFTPPPGAQIVSR